MRLHVVFVYGSLKRGESNQHYLATAEFIARARTAAEFSLFRVGRYATLARVNEKPRSIMGEIYRVDDETLAALDRLEDNGRWYLREIATMFDLDQPGLTHDAWVYLHLGDPSALERIDSDQWTHGM